MSSRSDKLVVVLRLRCGAVGAGEAGFEEAWIHFLGLGKKFTQTTWLKSTGTYSVIVLRLQVWDQGVGSAGSSWSLWGRVCSLLLSQLLGVAGHPGHSSLWLRHFLLCLCLPTAFISACFLFCLLQGHSLLHFGPTLIQANLIWDLCLNYIYNSLWGSE